MRKFTNQEKRSGELAVRNMSETAQAVYNSTDLLSVIEYTDYDATAKAEAEAEERGEDYYAGQLDVIRYAVNVWGDITDNLTFEEAEKCLEDYAEALKE